MNWAGVVDALFYVGALLATGCIAYGGWLSILAPKSDSYKARAGDRAGEATRTGACTAASANARGRKYAV
jgi:hypothetical protein